MCYINRAYIHGYYSYVYYYFINFTFCTFFSLSSSCKMNSVSDSPLLILFFLRYTQTHPHGQTNKEREISVDVGRLWIGGSELVVEIEVCGSTEMGLDAYELVLVVEISACGSTKSVFVGFDSCGACGGDWYLWWRLVLVVER